MFETKIHVLSGPLREPQTSQDSTVSNV